MDKKIHFTKLRESGYAITSIVELTPGEEIFIVCPYSEQGHSTKTFFLGTGYSEKTLTEKWWDADKVFSYVRSDSVTGESGREFSAHYDSYNLAESKPEGWVGENFIVRAAAIENVEVDWTNPKPLAPERKEDAKLHLSSYVAPRMKVKGENPHRSYYVVLDEIDFGEMY